MDLIKKCNCGNNCKHECDDHKCNCCKEEE